MTFPRSSFVVLSCLLAVAVGPSASAGAFQSVHTYQTGGLPSAAVVRDFNHDGFVDIATANRNNKDISVLLGKADGTFATAMSYAISTGPFEIAAGDLNGDGNPDLAVTDDFGAVDIFLGVGDGTFQAPDQIALHYAPEGVRVVDLNGDGKLDLAIANKGADEEGEGSVSILLGKGDGTFKSPRYYQAGQNPMRLTTVDLNGDGKLDLAVADENCCEVNSLAVLLGNGDGTFQSSLLSTPGVASDVSAGDLNGDGKVDLVLAGEFGGSIRVVLGNGDGTFKPAVGYAVPNSALTLVLTDVSADGNADVLVGSMSGVNVLLGKSDGTFGTAVTYGVGSEFVAVGDFNRDQTLDLIAGGSSFIGVAFGAGQGTFRAPRIYSVGTLIDGTAMGDFNLDGNPDLVLAKQPPNGTLSILLGNGDGTFAQGANFSNITPSHVIAADFNGDSRLDLSVAASGVDIYLGKGDGTFLQPKFSPTGSTPISQTAGDFNHDQYQDLATANQYGNNISVLLGNGDGTFQPRVDYAAGNTPTAIVASDFNHDGNLDLAVTNVFSSTVEVYLGNGDGTFQSGLNTESGFANALAAGDFNRDGKPDLVISGGTSTQVLLGNGDGSFQSPQAVMAASGIVKLADVNRDGKFDLVVSDLGEANGLVNVALGRGDGTFRAATTYFTGGFFSGWLALGDFDHDGFPDLTVTDLSENVTVLLNNSQR